eukprot:CAMPEP_0169289324 /NCGR_PEP_ID=MMETSP1016-20121227/61072_1 /TAXON_ID=342587 /ORGANISM="Karlodinium micrum, Strain CCMP2283" /LENGTH=146 /DNA_ID=CAMNT_0009379693 /DNA_START=374 /DNA_END=811 /DNA_ORIENTATION=+
MASFICTLRSSDARIRAQPGRRILLPSDETTSQLLACLTEHAVQEAKLQWAWEDITSPVRTATLERTVPNDSECLRVAGLAISNHPGSLEFNNPISRIPIHSRCPKRPLEYLLPLDLRYAIKQLQVMHVEEQPENVIVCDNYEDTR